MDICFCFRQWSEKEHSETSTLFMSSSEQKSNQNLISVWEWTPADLRITVWQDQLIAQKRGCMHVDCPR